MHCLVVESTCSFSAFPADVQYNMIGASASLQAEHWHGDMYKAI